MTEKVLPNEMKIALNKNTCPKTAAMMDDPVNSERRKITIHIMEAVNVQGKDKDNGNHSF